VYETIGKEFGEQAVVTRQTKGIGLTFGEDDNMIHLDIVPGREINNYALEGKLNLFVKPDWAWQNGGSFKTNIRMQRNITSNKPQARTVIKLLKAYRDRNGLALPSLIIDQYVVESLNERNFGVQLSTTENLINSMNFIAIKLQNSTLRDLANSSNNLLDKMSEMEKQQASNQLSEDFARMKENVRYIKEIFEC